MAVIRVSGKLGSGKTTLCVKLARRLDYRYFYAGGEMRKFAEERGMPIEEFYVLLEADPDLEKSIDERQVQLMSQDNVVAEGRMAPFLPCRHRIINLFIDVNEDEGAKRILGRPENKGRTLEDVKQRTCQRYATERERYKNLYGIEDYLDKRHFDIVIDTTEIESEEVCNLAYVAIYLRLKSELPRTTQRP